MISPLIGGMCVVDGLEMGLESRRQSTQRVPKVNLIMATKPRIHVLERGLFIIGLGQRNSTLTIPNSPIFLTLSSVYCS
jgi:hypothetical protein